MKNTNAYHIHTCILMSFDEFKSLIERLTHELLTVINDFDGISTTPTEKADESEEYWNENGTPITTLLSNYFGVNVTSYHCEANEESNVWIVCDNE